MSLNSDDAADPDPPGFQPPQPEAPVPTSAGRIVAILEILLCSGYPTQLALGSALVVLGFAPVGPDGTLNIAYVATVSLIDTLVVIGLVSIFLTAHRERPRSVLFGDRPLVPELRHGLVLTFGAYVLAIVVLGLILQFAPRLHTVEQNPLQNLMRTPRDAALFGLVAVFAGGVREEIQRAFVLHRFEQWLGGATVGVVVSSILFGIGHVPQGLDAVIATGLLGAFWALVYVARRSIVAPMVSHAGFNLLQLAQFLVIGR